MLIFLLSIISKTILTIPLLIRNTRIILVLTLSTGVPLTVVNELEKRTVRTWLNKQNLFCLVECCDILIEGLANLFSAIEFSNKKIFHFFYSADFES